ncbi:Hypothetical protein A7982_03461 [Minicystis rosea]|nr:Hypothetical protein A7982_03461 [Minicystis rosea]
MTRARADERAAGLAPGRAKKTSTNSGGRLACPPAAPASRLSMRGSSDRGRGHGRSSGHVARAAAWAHAAIVPRASPFAP